MIALDSIVCIDCIEGLRSLPAESVDLVLTSPPYNFGMGYDKHEDKIDYARYFSWLKEVFGECKRVLVDGGRLAVNIQPNFYDYVPSHHRISAILESLGLSFKGEIIWNKNNYNCKVCSFGSWKSASMPYFKYKWEFVEVFCKGKLKHDRREGHEDDISAKEFVEWTTAMWDIAPEKRMQELGHPAMMPEELAKRCIKLLTFTNDVVLDPFNGVGTTTLVADRFKRRYIGFDISEQYCSIARRRIDEQHRRGVQEELFFDEIISHLQSAKHLADRDCPYDAEFLMYAAQRSFRDAVEIVKKCSDNYEKTADALRCDAKQEEVKEKQEPADQNQYKDIELAKE